MNRGGAETPEGMLALARSDPNWLTLVLEQDPELGAALVDGDIAKIRTLYMQRILKNHKKEYAKKKEIDEIARNPDDPENQLKMMEAIR